MKIICRLKVCISGIKCFVTWAQISLLQHETAVNHLWPIRQQTKPVLCWEQNWTLNWPRSNKYNWWTSLIGSSLVILLMKWQRIKGSFGDALMEMCSYSIFLTWPLQMYRAWLQRCIGPMPTSHSAVSKWLCNIKKKDEGTKDLPSWHCNLAATVGIVASISNGRIFNEDDTKSEIIDMLASSPS